MKIEIPELSLVVLIGASGSGKSTFAKKHFKGTEILSSDYCRGLVSDDENNLKATNDAFDVLQYIAKKRLKSGKLCVIDATNVRREDRQLYIKLAREFHVLPVVIVLNIPATICHERNKSRLDRNFASHVTRSQYNNLKRSIKGLKREGFRHIFKLSPEEIDKVEISREKLWNNKRDEVGPFDIIGDIHGCYDELIELIEKLGYKKEKLGYIHPEGRKLFFLGDLVDRGPKTPEVLKLVMSLVNSNYAYCVPGNHDAKLQKKLIGKSVNLKHGLAETLEQLEKEPPEFLEEIKEFVYKLVSHYVLDNGKLVVAHAGMKETMQGRGSGMIRQFAMYGETTGESDEFGFPVRYQWSEDYRGKALVVYGHTPVLEPDWINNTVNIDTGCVFGGKLTALRYPEKESISVQAKKIYANYKKPFLEDEKKLSSQQASDDILDIKDVLGKRIITTRLRKTITIREENSIAALEAMSRFAVNPKWLIYLPPTMSPCETSKKEGILEHPDEAFKYYQNQGIDKLICEEKHMGSRAIVVICKTKDVAKKRFGVLENEIGVCYTRTGRRFFNEDKTEEEFLLRLKNAVDKSNLWNELNTDWLCLDCEIMPWSAKAQQLLKEQYAPVGLASQTALKEVISSLEKVKNKSDEIKEIIDYNQKRLELAEKYCSAYQQYCWEVNSLDDIKLAPFHILASQNKVNVDQNYQWHMDNIKKISEQDDIIISTNYKIIKLNDEKSVNEGISWWEELTSKGGEGMVVKPLNFIEKGKNGIVQPAIKCRGKEYLRIIYGLEYTIPKYLERLKSRGLSTKRAIAMREFALGVESLERFVDNKPLRQVHECTFGVLALESEPVDPRL